MLIGIYWGYVALMEGAARMRMQGRDQAGRSKSSATGGLSVAVRRSTTDAFDDALVPDLTIQGLALLYCHV